MTKRVEKKDSVLEGNEIDKRKVFIWLGIALILLGVFLPWVRVGHQSATGIQLNEGVISVALGVLGTLFAYFRQTIKMPPKLGATAIVFTGLIVCFITGQTLSDTRKTARQLNEWGTRATQVDQDFKTTTDSIRRNIENKIPVRIPTVPMPSGARNFEVRPEFGAFVTLAGGVLLSLGGLLSFRSPKVS